jgi:hypothetical protein
VCVCVWVSVNLAFLDWATILWLITWSWRIPDKNEQFFPKKNNYTDNRLRWKLNQIAQKSVAYFLGGVIEANYIKLRFLSKFLKLKERHIWLWHSIYMQYISLQWQLDKGAKKSVMIFFGGFIPANYWMLRILSTYWTSDAGQVRH